MEDLQKMPARLDKRDYRLLSALERNARAPLGELAKAAGISVQLAAYRLKRLEDARIILGYHAIIDTSRLGFITYRVYLRFRSVTAAQKRTLQQEIAKMPEVSIILGIDGRWDSGMAVMVRDIYDFHAFWDRLMVHRERIAQYEVNIYSPVYHFTRDFLSPHRGVPQVRVLGGKESVPHDELDLRILRLLAPNVRRPLTAISRALGHPVQTVINRVRAMERNGIIQGYLPILDWGALGYSYYKVDMALRSRTHLAQMERYAQRIPYIVQIDKTIGGSDFEIELYCRSKQHFERIMDELQQRFPGDVESYEYFTVNEVFKEEFMPKEASAPDVRG